MMFESIKTLFKRKPTAKSMKDSLEPWVNVVKAHVDPSNPKQGYFELEWNPAFVMFLISNGYTGPSPEEIVDQWFTDLCRNVGMDGMADGSFIADGGRIATNAKTKNQK
jgi:hypothetical protein